MYEKVKALLVEELSINEEDITPEAELENDLGINSLDLADLIFTCEEKFKVHIDDEEIKNLVTVGDVVAFLEKLSA